jgi:hypothetical protein
MPGDEEIDAKMCGDIMKLGNRAGATRVSEVGDTRLRVITIPY